MKKTIFLIFLTLLFITGCTSKLTFNKKEITSIRDNQITVLKTDYDDILKYIEQLSLSKREINVKNDNTLTITTKDNIHIFQISNDNKIKYQVGTDIFYSNNQKTIKKLRTSLHNLSKTYQNKNYYTISELTKYKENENDLFVKIDNVTQYFSLISQQPLISLQVHKVEYQNGSYHDIDLIYETKNIPSKKQIIFRMNPRKDYFNYRISFTNKYGMFTSIIPSYDNEQETGNLTYIINHQYKAI
ncbi:MAG: hypothetical protein HFG15_02055 [Bacilli bacterium]|nr:hypothetical protein [Bacilli bacterium]